MAAIVLFVSAFVLLALGALLKRKTSPYSRIGGDEYTRRQTRKLVADVITVAGWLVLVVALLSAFIPGWP